MEKTPKVFWVLQDPALPEIICIDAPPEVYQNKVTGDRIDKRFWRSFIRVVEFVPPSLEIPCD